MSNQNNTALEQLREIVKPGDTIYTILRHVTRSGMSRSVSAIKIGKDGTTHELDWLIIQALDERMDRNHSGIKIGGCGFDAGFELVYRLSMALYGPKHGYKCLGKDCPSNSHVNDRNAPRGSKVRHTDGYALNQKWL